MVKMIFLTVFFVLVQTVLFAATKTFNATSGDWNTAANWSPIGEPNSTDDVIIPAGKTVNISADAFAKSINVSGILIVNNSITLTVYGKVDVVSGGEFSAGTGNSDSAIIKVYGGFTNNGTANFWKSIVVIAGDLVTVRTILQNNGNIIVGGNVSGDIEGSGFGVVYPVNPNATVVITGGASQQLAGTLPPAGILLDLTNEVIYGGFCSFTINDITNVSACSGSNAMFTVATNAGSPQYKWQVNTNGSGWVDLTNSASYSGVSTASLTITGVTISMNSYKFRAKITSSSCSKSGNYGILTVNSSPIITTQPIAQLDCEGASVNFTAIATGTGPTYTWQRKKPTDASFITIPDEGNVSYPSTGKIKIDNVGSSQSPSGTQYQVIVSNGICSVASAIATLSVNEITGVTPTATNVKQCYGTNYSYTVTTSTPSPGYVVSYKWKKSVASGPWNDVVDDDFHYSGATTATLNILNGSPAESAEYRVYITFHSSGADCNVSSTTRTRLITFLPELLTPVTVIIQPTCATATGTITVTKQSETDTYSFDDGVSYQSSNVKSVLNGGSYRVFIKNSGGCISPVANCVITATVESTWNGSSWSPSAPTCVDKIIFNGNYSSTSDLVGCSCRVNSGAVVINSGNTLTLTDQITVSGGSLTFENNSSLIQDNDVAINTGNITYKRITAPIRKFDYTYWSSPVVGYTLGGVSPNTLGDKFYSFNAGIENWAQESVATVMSKGIGYIVRGPQNYDPVTAAAFPAVFVGVPNNGAFSLNSIAANKSYLLGNPYPSALDADKFLTDNSSVLDGTLYFWTHNTAIGAGVANQGIGAYAYSSDDYASYNLTGGVSTSVGQTSNMPSGKIASGQGFFATTKPFLTGSQIEFKNNMRVGVGSLTGNNSQFFKMTKNSKTTSSVEKNRIWLNLTNTQGVFKQTLVGYITDATNEFDDRFDGESFDGNKFVDFYSVNQGQNLVIQGRALPFNEKDEVPLGFRTNINGAFTISIDQADGLLAHQSVFLQDKLTNMVFDLKSGNYTFNTIAGTFNDRFVLKYTETNKTLGVGETDKEDGILAFYSNNYKTLIIKNNMDSIVNSVTLFSMTAQNIDHWDIKDEDQCIIQIPIKNINSGIYIVKFKTSKGESSKKIIVN